MGCLTTLNSIISFTNYVVFENNSALSGVALNALYGTVLMSGKALFMQNRADTDGGALFLSGTNTVLMNKVKFASNSAQNGGAMYFSSMATLTLMEDAIMNSSHNYASRFGGVIFYDDNTVLSVQCKFQFHQRHSRFEGLPDCFLHMNPIQRYMYTEQTYAMNTYNDTAARDGNYLYGGLLDRCLVNTSGLRSLSKAVLHGKLPTLHAET